MTVVSNMSPLHYLIVVGCDRILPLLYGQVFAPPAVIDEMRAPTAPEAVRQWADSPPQWLEVVAPSNIEDIPRLGHGKMRVVTIIDLLLIEIIDGSRGLHTAELPFDPSLCSRSSFRSLLN